MAPAIAALAPTDGCRQNRRRRWLAAGAPRWSESERQARGAMSLGTHVGATQLDPEDEEELLLIVSGLGLIDASKGGTGYLVGSECSDCLRDMQRYLRRDDQHVLACHRALGAWRVLQTHLLPILRTCKNDSKLVFDVLKVAARVMDGAPRPLALPELVLSPLSHGALQSEKHPLPPPRPHALPPKPPPHT
eukprot:scaffold11294_cov117-Isochrysis_galbana.AAC.7